MSFNKGRMTLGEVVDYLAELPRDLEVLTHLVEDNTFTVLIDTQGNATTMRNRDKDYRWLVVTGLPPRH